MSTRWVRLGLPAIFVIDRDPEVAAASTAARPRQVGVTAGIGGSHDLTRQLDRHWITPGRRKLGEM